MIGYVQLYFKVVGEKETYYAAFDGEFGKPLTWFRLLSIKRNMKRTYERFDKIYSVEFCTKDEWEKNRCGDEVHLSWGED